MKAEQWIHLKLEQPDAADKFRDAAAKSHAKHSLFDR
jgi:hypothetical protein